MVPRSSAVNLLTRGGRRVERSHDVEDGAGVSTGVSCDPSFLCMASRGIAVCRVVEDNDRREGQGESLVELTVVDAVTLYERRHVASISDVVGPLTACREST